MSAYIDSAIIVKLYVQEPNSQEAVAFVSAEPAPYPLTPWQDVEVRTAMRFKAFRGEITADELRAALAAFDEDIRLGRWQKPYETAWSWELAGEATTDAMQELLKSSRPARIWELTSELSARHAAQVGCRTLDLIHVAAGRAVWLRCVSVTDFCRICSLDAPRHPGRHARNPRSGLLPKRALSGFSLYQQFRPRIPGGLPGRGAKDGLNRHGIRKLAVAD